ncbi:protein-serine O-palmitoleoyltransferase por [Oratosquilla oratoria]|uniref:protein-serine O-palmitoleoyltransferase por n=1 Tax=Oratosquilla oratoria TaxID=337810 RepID=UPI003F767248
MEYTLYGDYDYEPEGEYADYYDDEYYEIPENGREEDIEEAPPVVFTLKEILEYCVAPTLADSSTHLTSVLVWSAVFTLTSRIVKLPSLFIHLASVGCGAAVTWFMFNDRSSFMIAHAGIGLIILIFTHYVLGRLRGPVSCFVCVAFLIVCELHLAKAADWHSIRGAQMIILMKIVSIGYDVDSAIIPSLPNPIEYAGYIFNPGTVIFGPWISITAYRHVCEPMTWSFMWIGHIVRSLFWSLFFLLNSTCMTMWLIPDTAFRWARAYRDALSYRSSHYFVSYLSEASANIGGLQLNGVAQPQHVEVPRSLVEVVIYWNMPMHHWLKTYVFRKAKGHLGAFWAILLTYAMSALFHGLNFQLAAVLLSLGFYTFVEFSFRQKFGDLLDACVLSRPCQENCGHKYKSGRWFIRLLNIAFGALAVMHLAYLGVMFDSSPQEQEKGYSMEHTLLKWSTLNFVSHWIVLAFYIVYSVL